jgi:hypothetical protein
MAHQGPEDQQIERAWKKVGGGVGESHQRLMGVYGEARPTVNFHQSLMGHQRARKSDPSQGYFFSSDFRRDGGGAPE